MSAFIHSPVLLTEVLANYEPRPGGRYVDGTIGGGGHAEAILRATGGRAWLLGIDRDGAALTASRQRLAEYEGQYELRHGTFDRLAEWVLEASCDGVLFDLGVSSPQFDDPDRGFSFQHDGPLDMRQDRTQALTAAEIVNTATQSEIERILAEYGEEPHARRLARRIVEERKASPLKTTRQLAAIIEREVARAGARIHPATKAFMGLRIAVNDEIGILGRGLVAACRVLKEGGRLAVITFHSIEARVVKAFGTARTRDYEFDGEVDVPELRRPRQPEMRWVVRRAITAGPGELASNPRSRSAQLRVLERLGHAA